MLDKADSEVKIIFMNTEIYFIILKGVFHQESLTILNLYAFNSSLQNYSNEMQDFTGEKSTILCKFDALFWSLRAQEERKREEQLISLMC